MDCLTVCLESSDGCGPRCRAAMSTICFSKTSPAAIRVLTSIWKFADRIDRQDVAKPFPAQRHNESLKVGKGRLLIIRTRHRKLSKPYFNLISKLSHSYLHFFIIFYRSHIFSALLFIDAKGLPIYSSALFQGALEFVFMCKFLLVYCQRIFQRTLKSVVSVSMGEKRHPCPNDMQCL